MTTLTQSVVENAPYSPAGQMFLRDSDLRGFALRITKGTKTFVYEKRVHGRMRRTTLGRLGVISLEEARSQASKMAGDIAKGVIPSRLRKRATFGELADRYLELHAPRKRSARNDRAVLRNHLAGWRPRVLSEIKADQVQRLHEELGRKTPYQANRVVALLRKMYNLAEEWGLFTGENPAARIIFHREEKRRRFLQPDELPRLFEALKEEPNEHARAAFVTALFTGARRDEILSMKWEDVSDLTKERAVWRIRQPGSAPLHLLPLPAPLAAVLCQLRKTDDNPYVFAGRNEHGHLVNVKRAWRRIRTKAGIADVRINDLRRTFGAWLAAGGESLPLIGQALNLSTPLSPARFADLHLDPIREALERNVKRMLLGKGKIGPAFSKGAVPTTTVQNPLMALTSPEQKEKTP